MSRQDPLGAYGSSSKPTGVRKRRAEDDLRNEQRLAKRFDLLNLDQNGKLYVSVQQPPHQQPSYTNGNDDGMQVDDMKDRVYIRNLDDELKEVELEEERIIFLPDIEKKLGKIPKSVLVGESHPTTGKEMVLYSVPSSLSIPEEHDKVKKAIIESRARAREKQLQVAEAGVTLGNGMSKTPNGVQNLSHVAGDDIISLEEDPDAMDLG